MFLVADELRAPWLRIRITGRGGSPRLVRQEPGRNRAGALGVQIEEINSSGLSGASEVPTALEPAAARSSRRNLNHIRNRLDRRRRSAGCPNPRCGANRHASHPRQRRKSAPARPRPMKPRQLQRARVCVTWLSPPQVRCRGRHWRRRLPCGPLEAPRRSVD